MYLVGVNVATENYKDIRTEEGSITKYLSSVLGNLFTIRMLIHLPFIIFSASITTVYESLVFYFLSFNAIDKTNIPELSLPFFVLVGYWLVQLIFGYMKCNKCFETYDYGRRSTRVCGSIVNFFILSIGLTVVTVGALADNDKLDIPFLKGFSLYTITSLLIGICTMIMNRQRKSMAL